MPVPVYSSLMILIFQNKKMIDKAAAIHGSPIFTSLR